MTNPSYVRVIIDRAIHRELDYAVPEALVDRVGVGSRVRVPFRDKSALATVVAITEQSEAKGIRIIEAVVGEAPILSEQLLELGRWISAYYCCPIETVMRSLLPQVIRRAEIGWKKQLFVQPRRKIDNEKLEVTKTRAPAGRTSGGDLAIESSNPRVATSTANLPRQPDASRTGETRPRGVARRSSRAGSTC